MIEVFEFFNDFYGENIEPWQTGWCLTGGTFPVSVYCHNFHC